MPGKNIRLFNGKPLIAYTIEAAIAAKHIDRVIVSTDDDKIAQVATSYGAEIPFLRPAHLASDTATTAEVIAHMLKYFKSIKSLPEHYVLLQPTCPLRTAKHIDAAAELYFKRPFASLISVCTVIEHPYTMKKVIGEQLHELIKQKDKPTNRQQYPQFVRLNGAIYMGRSQLFLQKESFHLKPCCPYMMSRELSIDIDTEEDFIAAEKAYVKKGAEKR